MLDNQQRQRHDVRDGQPYDDATVHPGGIRTPIVGRARVVASVGEAQRSAIIARFEQSAWIDPDAAADRIVKGVRRNERRILVGGDAYLLDWLQRVFPISYWSVLGRLWGPTRRRHEHSRR